VSARVHPANNGVTTHVIRMVVGRAWPPLDSSRSRERHIPSTCSGDNRMCILRASMLVAGEALIPKLDLSPQPRGFPRQVITLGLTGRDARSLDIQFGGVLEVPSALD